MGRRARRVAGIGPGRGARAGSAPEPIARRPSRGPRRAHSDTGAMTRTERRLRMLAGRKGAYDGPIVGDHAVLGVA